LAKFDKKEIRKDFLPKESLLKRIAGAGQNKCPAMA